MPRKEILSLTPSGLRSHAELVKSYDMVSQFGYDLRKGWNKNGALDYTRDLRCNGVSLQGKDRDEIESFIFSQVDGEVNAEPSMLARVMVSAIAAQFCEGALSTIVGQQILLSSGPFDVQHKTLAVGNKKRTIPVKLDGMQLVTPHGQMLNWQTDQQHCTKNSVLHFHFIQIKEPELGFMAMKKGDTELTFISDMEYLDWVSRFQEKTPLPFEVEPLVSVHATIELNESYSKRSQLAVFFEYTNVNIILHYPDLLGFRHVRETIKRPAVNPESANVGYIPFSNTNSLDSYQPPVIQTSVYYSELNTGVVPFSALQVDRDDSHYRLDTVDSIDDNEAIAIIRRSMKMQPAILSERAIVVEKGNEHGAAFLSLQAKNLQATLVGLIAQKRLLETSRAQMQNTKTRLFNELMDVQSTVAALTIIEEPIKSFEIKKASADKLTTEQFLAAYAFLFFPPAEHRDYSSPFAKHLKDHHIWVSEYAKEQSTVRLLKHLSFYELNQESELNTIIVSKHRIYEMVEGRILTEPFEFNLDRGIKDQLALFHRVIFTAKHDAKRYLSQALIESAQQQGGPLPQSVEIIIPLLYMDIEKKTVDSTLICFKCASNTLPLEGEEIEFKINLFSPRTKSNSTLSRFFLEEDSPKACKKVETLLCSKIHEMFNESKGQQLQSQRHDITYNARLFDKSIALLDILTNYLSGLSLEGEHSCQYIRKEVCMYLKFIDQIPQADPVLICEEKNRWISIKVRQPLFEGRPVTLVLKLLNGQLDAIKAALEKQEDVFKSFDEKIGTCLRGIKDACEVTQHAPTADATSLNAIERLANMEMELVDLRSNEVALLAQIHTLKAELSTFKNPAKAPVPDAALSAKTSVMNVGASSSAGGDDKLLSSVFMAELKSKIKKDERPVTEEADASHGYNV